FFLGVSKSAGADELKRAYRKLAMQYHPDRNAGDKGAEQKFKDLNEAYDILKDDQKRAAYDRFGHAAFEQGGGRGPGDFGFNAGGFADIFDEVFGEMMGGGRRGQGGPNRGSDLRYNLEFSLEEAFRGKQTTIRVPNLVASEQCNGSGGANSYCRVPLPITTAALGGTIEVPTVDGSRTRVTVPAGTQSGHQFRLRSKGMTVMRSAARGDMFIEAVVETPVNLSKRQQE